MFILAWCIVALERVQKDKFGRTRHSKNSEYETRHTRLLTNQASINAYAQIHFYPPASVFFLHFCPCSWSFSISSSFVRLLIFCTVNGHGPSHCQFSLISFLIPRETLRTRFMSFTVLNFHACCSCDRKDLSSSLSKNVSTAVCEAQIVLHLQLLFLLSHSFCRVWFTLSSLALCSGARNSTGRTKKKGTTLPWSHLSTVCILFVCFLFFFLFSLLVLSVVLSLSLFYLFLSLETHKRSFVVDFIVVWCLVISDHALFSDLLIFFAISRNFL